MSVCPICEHAAAARAENSSHPFCSRRCKQIDLGKWLDEKYGVPARDEAGEDGERIPDSPQEKP